MVNDTGILRTIANGMREEAENISPLNGASGGETHPAPSLRRWAAGLERIAERLEGAQNEK